jgi:hypothetical protein
MSLARALALAVVLGGCAHHPLAGADLDRVARPAFVSRMVEDAGPRAEVFREDSSYRPKLKRLEPAEADRRLAAKLSKAMTRFEISERLRAGTLAQLPRERPWTQTVDPARVATALESFLVEEVPATVPDFELLKPLGVDAVVELVIESYGMRSEHGQGFAFVEGYGRMFFLEGAEIWRSRFRVDGRQGRDPLDPFLVAKEPERLRAEVTALLDGAAAQLALELSPKDRRGGPPVPGGGDGLSTPPDDTNKTGKENQKEAPKRDDELPPGELPPPDAPPPPKG